MQLYITLLEHPGEFYASATDEVRRRILTAFYARIWVDDDGHATSVVAEPREVVVEIRAIARQTSNHAPSAILPSGEAESSTPAAGQAPSGGVASAACSTKTEVVGAEGLEPPTPSL